MLFDYISIFAGMIKIVLYTIIYHSRISYKNIPKINGNFHISLRKGTSLIIGKNFKGRNNINIRNDKMGKILIGNNVFFNDNVSLNCQNSIIIGDNVAIGHNVLIIDHDHDYKRNMKNFISKEIKIGSNVWIGANVTILKGVTIGNNVVVGANTLIKNDIGSNQIILEKKEYFSKEIKKEGK